MGGAKVVGIHRASFALLFFVRWLCWLVWANSGLNKKTFYLLVHAAYSEGLSAGTLGPGLDFRQQTVKSFLNIQQPQAVPEPFLFPLLPIWCSTPASCCKVTLCFLDCKLLRLCLVTVPEAKELGCHMLEAIILSQKLIRCDSKQHSCMYKNPSIMGFTTCSKRSSHV